MSRKPAALLLTCVCLCLAGCGAGNSAVAQEQSAVARMGDSLHAYNAAIVGNLSQQAAVCRQAAASLSGARPLPSARLPSNRAEAAVLVRAYELALAGFKTCTLAAGSLDYPGMVKAANELEAASNWIEAARRMETRA